jgi:hypothetical protein
MYIYIYVITRATETAVVCINKQKNTASALTKCTTDVADMECVLKRC